MTAHMIGDRELAAFRQQYYGLFVSLFAREPTEELLRILGQDIYVRADATAALHPELGLGWETMAGVLPAQTPEKATEEFLRLFIGPLQPEATPYESWYLTGQLFQRPLLAVREFIQALGLERDEERFPEPEDVIAFELEIMNWLVTRQMEAQTPDEEAAWLQRQQQFLKEHLLVWVPALTVDLERAKSANFYKSVAKLLRGFLVWEQVEFERGGMGKVLTLEEARARYPQRPRYRGPIAEEQFEKTPPPKLN
jgi:TorA maturation chaperone TorD